MILFFVGVFITLILAWVWGSRGFLSALIHMLCVIVAGAIAFGLWETTGYAILDAADTKKWVVDIAWGVALAVPFSLILAVLRVGIDKAIPFNTDLDGTSNLVGGMVCGAISGIIATGIMTISITNCRISTESLEFTMVEYDTNGSMKKVPGYASFFPRATGWLYSYMSENSLRTDTPMAKYRPDMPYEGSLLRTNFNNGTSRLAIVPKAVQLDKRYTIGLKSIGKHDVKSLVGGGQTVTPFGEDSPISLGDKNYYIDAYVVKFKSLARETEGRVIVGNSQISLIVRNAEDTKSLTLLPVAMVSQADVLAGEEKVRFWRWSFAAPNKYVASVGGADDPPMAFEFLVPKGYTAIALNVKGVRLDPTKVPQGEDFEDAEKRVKAIQRYGVIALPAGAKGYSEREWGGVGTVQQVATAYSIDGSKAFSLDHAISVNDSMPFSMILSTDNKGDLKVDDRNNVEEGTAAFKNGDLKRGREIDQKLQIRRISAGEGTVIVRVDISNTSLLSYTKSKLATEGIGAPVLVDNLGQRYSAIGYGYQDSLNTYFKLDPGSPIGSVKDLPEGGPSESRNDQKFILIYRVTANVKLKTFDIGSNVVAKIEPNIEIKKN